MARLAATDSQTKAEEKKLKSSSSSISKVAANDESSASIGLLALFYLNFAAALGALSQLQLRPVYGSMVAGSHHVWLMCAGVILGSLVHFIHRTGRSKLLQLFLPVSAAVSLGAQAVLCRYSGQLGSSQGPLLTEVITLLPVVALSILCAAQEMGAAKVMRASLRDMLMLVVPAFLTVFSLPPLLEAVLTSMGKVSDLLTGGPLSALVASLAMIPASPDTAAGLLPAIYGASWYYRQSMQNNTISALMGDTSIAHWRVLDKKQSNTGYIEVLENEEEGYRVLRCDHSLLGGEWLVTEKMRANGMTGTEPIYSVFTMLEAVRLIETERKHRNQEKALVIGLGIGTAPKALLAHGVNVTLVELDPVVHDFAVKYFNLPMNHTAHLEDAVEWVQNEHRQTRREQDYQKRARLEIVPQLKYDFIIHDVFTGGAEPLPLFTASFIHGLQDLLDHEGAIAINFAGDTAIAPSKQVVHTINTVFKGRCRIFRDLEPEAEVKPDETEFVNMVIYCLHPQSSHPQQQPSFRAPRDSDYLSSLLRRQHLMPLPANQLAFPTKEEMAAEKIEYIDGTSVNSFKAAQLASARRHWGIMRTVMPDAVWYGL